MLLEHQFLGDDYVPADGLPRWVRHYSHVSSAARVPAFHARLAALGCAQACFSAAVREINRTRVIFDTLALAGRMEDAPRP